MSFEPALYRFAARAMFAPFGGLDTLRSRALDSLGLKEGDRVLELGCGPGDVTAELIRRGARVHAIDSSNDMLRVAAKRAPHATFEKGDVRSFTSHGTYDVVLIFFVLHELPTGDVKDVIDRAAGVLEAGGRLAIVDHAIPSGSGGETWQRILRLVESDRIDKWLTLDLRALVRAAGLQEEVTSDLAGGRAQLLVAARG